jgi:hypothetical protein
LALSPNKHFIGYKEHDESNILNYYIYDEAYFPDIISNVLFMPLILITSEENFDNLCHTGWYNQDFHYHVDSQNHILPH